MRLIYWFYWFYWKINKSMNHPTLSWELVTFCHESTPGSLDSNTASAMFPWRLRYWSRSWAQFRPEAKIRPEFSRPHFRSRIQFLGPIRRPPVKNLSVFDLQQRKKVWTLIGPELRRIIFLQDNSSPRSWGLSVELFHSRETGELSGRRTFNGVHQPRWWRHQITTYVFFSLPKFFSW